MAAYGVGHVLWFLPANVFWHPPAGWRFAFLALLPVRWWPWPLAVELLVFLSGSGNIRRSAGSAALALSGFALHRALTLVGPLLLRRSSSPLLDDRPSAILRLLGAMLASGFAATLYTIWWLPPLLQGDEAAMPQGLLFLQLLMGDFIGMLLIVPVALMMVSFRPGAAILRNWRFDIPLILLPALALYAVVRLQASAQIGLFATMLCVLPVMYFAFRSGWRGVALAFPVASSAIAACNVIADEAILSLQAQLLLGTTGVACLLLGASIDELRASRSALHQYNAQLISANVRLDRYSEELREAARRNLNLSEDVRRWITAELHDELGQNLTALQTRLTLVERRTHTGDLLRPVWPIIDGMRRSISSLMSALRPAGLDEFGLVQALEHGPIRRLVESAGLAYGIRVEDPVGVLDALDDHARTALYRIVQEAATNTVRHANARNLHVRLRCKPGSRIALLISDDGDGIPSLLRKGGMGLQGIRDRAMSMDGRLRLSTSTRGTRMLVRLNLSSS